MHYLTVSFTHKNTDISIREKLALSEEEKRTNFQNRLKEYPTINETIVLSTCNRVEIILSVTTCDETIKYIYEVLSDISGVDVDDLEERADVYEDNGAIFHLFSVISSLDSLVIGETQIVGQLKDAYKFSFDKGFCDQKLSRAMHHAFKCAAKVRNNTAISQSAISVSSVAVSMAKDLLGRNLGGSTALVIGAGEMSRLAAKHLITHGVNVIIINRNPEHAQSLADELGEMATIAPFSKLADLINRYKLVFSATGAPQPIITEEIIEEKEFERYWFDIAIPRDIENCDHDNIHIYAVDDLKELVEKNLAQREEQAKIAYSIVGKATMDFFKWLQSLCIDPIIKEIRDKAQDCAIYELNRAIKKGFIDEAYKEEVTKILHHSFNSFLHVPTKKLKGIAESAEADVIVQSVQYIFDINEDQSEKLNMYKCEYQMENNV
ncbi:glutamyl-tRNA reductase [Sulfurospirillum sp. 1612]|uniref:glutamyl-tRNA reductase n=1 Tax=Sulfurospirillum sp. 1612 TaxID=3094835 RepID=UPI002F94C97D